MKRLLAALFTPFFCGIATCGAVQVNFSGGSGTPLSLTLASPANYTITATGANAPFFVFDGLGDSFTQTGVTVSGNLTYSIDGGTAQTLTRLGSGRAANDVTADDSYLFSTTLPGVTIGDTVRLLAGTLTTSTNFAGAAPASGNFASFIAVQNGTRVSGFATNVPEPGTYALLAVGLGAGAVALGRRRTTA